MKRVKLYEQFVRSINESWNDNKEFDRLTGELMPAVGPAKTVEGEIVRAVNRLVYRYYNDGDYFYSGYGIETAGGRSST